MKTAMNKQGLMGKKVSFSSAFKRQYLGGGKRAWKSEPTGETRHGWIVGFRTIKDGSIRTGFDDTTLGAEPYLYFAATKYIKCVLISRTPYENPIKVPLDGFEVI